MGIFGIPSIAVICSLFAWLLMLGFGVAHAAGLIDTTIGYDTAMGLSLCAVPPVMLMLMVHALLVARASKVMKAIDEAISSR